MGCFGTNARISCMLMCTCWCCYTIFRADMKEKLLSVSNNEPVHLLVNLINEYEETGCLAHHTSTTIIISACTHAMMSIQRSSNFQGAPPCPLKVKGGSRTCNSNSNRTCSSNITYIHGNEHHSDGHSHSLSPEAPWRARALVELPTEQEWNHSNNLFVAEGTHCTAYGARIKSEQKFYRSRGRALHYLQIKNEIIARI